MNNRAQPTLPQRPHTKAAPTLAPAMMLAPNHTAGTRDTISPGTPPTLPQPLDPGIRNPTEVIKARPSPSPSPSLSNTLTQMHTRRHLRSITCSRTRLRLLRVCQAHTLEASQRNSSSSSRNRLLSRGLSSSSLFLLSKWFSRPYRRLNLRFSPSSLR